MFFSPVTQTVTWKLDEEVMVHMRQKLCLNWDMPLPLVRIIAANMEGDCE